MRTLFLVFLSIIFSLNLSAQVGSEFYTETTDITLTVDISKNEKDAFSTINEGLNAAIPYLKKGKSVRVKIHPGIYYEQIKFNVQEDDEVLANAPLIIEGIDAENTIISGLSAKNLKSGCWKKVKGFENVYEHEWNEDYELVVGYWANFYGAYPMGIGLRREMLVVDDDVFRMRILEDYRWEDPDGHKRSVAEELRDKNIDGSVNYRGIVDLGLACLDSENTFAVCANDDAPKHLRNRIFMRLPDGMTPKDYRSIRVSRYLNNNPAKEDEFFYLKNDALVQIINKNNLIIKNLSIKHAGTWLVGSGLRLDNCNNLTMENCVVTENNGAGTTYRGEHLTVRNCEFSYNGGKGFGGFWKFGKQNYMLFEEVDFCFNAHRTYEADFVDFDAAGIKISWANHVHFKNCNAVGNQASGFWHDIECSHIFYDHCFAYGNSLSGFFYELSRIEGDKGNDLSKNCIAAYNQREGFLMGDARKAAIENCLVVNNPTGICYRQMLTRKPVFSDEIVYIKVFNNTIISDDRYKVFVELTDPDNTLPVSYFNNNKYITVSRRDKFKIGGTMNFEKWKSELPNQSGKDQDSEYKIFNYSLNYLTFNKGSELCKMAEEMGVKIPYQWLDKLNDKN